MTIFSRSDDTLDVSILLLPESSMMTLASILDAMRAANRCSHQKMFSWQIMTLDGQPATLTCGIAVPSDNTFGKSIRGDLLILIGGFNQETHVNAKALSRLRSVILNFEAVAGVESGSWLLARTGLLNGHRATTHWEDFEDFSLAFPKVNVVPNRYVIDGKYITTGGASPSFDLMLRLIRERYSHHLALEVASGFIYDGAHPAEDRQPSVSLGVLEYNEPRVANAIHLMEAHIDDTLQIQEIAQRLSLSVRMLELLFVDTLDISPGQFYLRLRLQTAKRLVSDTRLKMQEIALRTGFNSAASFSRQFTKKYGISPQKLRSTNRTT